MFVSLVRFQLPQIPWVLWIVLEMSSVITLFQAKEELEVTQNLVHCVEFWQPTHEGGDT